MSDPEAGQIADLTALVSNVSDLYAARMDITRDDLWYLAKLSEELGELTSAWLSAHGRGRSRGLDQTALAGAVENEAADLFAFLLLFAAREGIDLDGALRRKWGRWTSETSSS
ncbi:MAG: hypothetical protein Q7J57_11065 [Gemmobacter sp.]|nr:hypothetical protein [Gemmobacter sp.]